MMTTGCSPRGVGLRHRDRTTNAIGGGILFAEFAAFTRAQWIGYPVGLSLLLGGVLLQTLKPPEPKAKGERGN